MMNTVFGENKDILELSSKDGAVLNQLHDPRVSHHLFPYSQHPSQQPSLRMHSLLVLVIFLYLKAHQLTPKLLTNFLA